MFLIRRAKIEDIPTLLKLARMVHFINLPSDKDLITDKVMLSRRSFLNAATGGKPTEAAANDLLADSPPDRKGGESGIGVAAMTARSNLFMFVIEDTESGGILGTSQIISHMGGPGVPNIYFQLTKREYFSTSLQQGGAHMVARLVLDESGPTEIGGLILQPSYRGHKLKLGRFLSLIRFHFMGLHRPLFSDRVLAEMMGPLTPDSRSTLWEYLGRRFINLTYEEADRFCQFSKEFMISLLPREDIYLTLLPPEARSVIGEVGPETLPARKMLERLGFKYRDRIDPFDGGPNLDAKMDDISIIRSTRSATLGPAVAEDACTSHGMVSRLSEDGEFVAAEIPYCVEVGHADGRIRLTKSAMRALEVESGMNVGVTPTGDGKKHAGNGTAARKTVSKPARRRVAKGGGNGGGE